MNEKDEISEITFVGLFPKIGELKILLDNNQGLNVKIYLVNGSENLLSDFDNVEDKWCLEQIKLYSVPNKSLCSMVYWDLELPTVTSKESKLASLLTLIDLISTFGIPSKLFKESEEVRTKALEFNLYLTLMKMEDFDDFEDEIDYILKTDFEKRLNDCFKYHINLYKRNIADLIIENPKNKLIVTDSFVDFWYFSNSKQSLYFVMEGLLKKFENKNIRITCIGKVMFDAYVISSMSLFTENGLKTTSNYLQSAGALDNFVRNNSGTENSNFMYMDGINRAQFVIPEQIFNRHLVGVFHEMYQNSLVKRHVKR